MDLDALDVDLLRALRASPRAGALELSRTLGVAHRSLPCGTRVTFYRGGRFVTLKVIDRGPFANGASFDLTKATADQLGADGVFSVGYAIIPA